MINTDELHFLARVALSDGLIDEEERAALRQIFSRADRAHRSAEVCAEIDAFRVRYAV